MAPPGTSDDTRVPPVAAVFLIRFDQRSGYTIAWQKSIASLTLDGIVEYKSLPSGLHNVREDLVYFVHNYHAGLAAFRNAPASEAERNATFVSVGVLVPKTGGRLGRIWLHASRLQRLAAEVLKDTANTAPLEAYWAEHQLSARDGAAASSSKSALDSTRPRSRALSESVTLSAPSQSLSPSHPALSTVDFLDAFGPLIFPLYRAALLRKRILFIAKPPVQELCEYVYVLSILSSVPLLAGDMAPERLSRSRTLFYTGIHDIPELEKLSRTQVPCVYTDDDSQHEESFASDEAEHMAGWIACTSDELLATKTNLYDIQVTFPGVASTAKERSQVWPTITSSEHGVLKATQRDLRRYKTLRQGLLRHGSSTPPDLPPNDDNDLDTTQLLHRRRPSTAHSHKTSHSALTTDPIPAESSVCEPLPWAAAMYDAALWWASAGEKSAELQEEGDGDASLLRSASGVWGSNTSMNMHAQNGAVEMALVAYFHHLSTKFLSVLHELSEPSYRDDDDEEQDDDASEDAERRSIIVSKDDLVRMGLDVWSQGDRTFIKELARLYFGVEAGVEGASVECCGLKIY